MFLPNALFVIPIALFCSRCQVRFIIIIITIASFCQSRAFIFRVTNFPCDLILATNVLEDLEVLKVNFLYRWMSCISLHISNYAIGSSLISGADNEGNLGKLSLFYLMQVSITTLIRYCPKLLLYSRDLQGIFDQSLMIWPREQLAIQT